MRFRPRLFWLAVLCSFMVPPSWSADPSPSPQPMEWTTAQPNLKLREKDAPSQSGTLLDGYIFSQPGASIAPERPTPPPLLVPPPVPAAAEPSSPVNAFIWLVLGVVILLTLALLGRRLYFDNAFGKPFQFPTTEVTPRLGGSYSGGLGAAIFSNTGEPIPPRR